MRMFAARARAAIPWLPGAGFLTLALALGTCRCTGGASTRERGLAQPRAATTSAAQASVAATGALEPRPLSPQSGSTVYSTRVIFDWVGEGVHAELSRDRAFTTPRTLRVTDRGNTAVQLEPGIWFWRVVGPEGQRTERVWALRVVDQIARPLRQGVLQGADINGDMLADIFIEEGVVTGRTKLESRLPARPPRILGAVPKLLRPAPSEPPMQWGTPAGIGDVNGDGRQDAVVQVARRAMEPDERVIVTMLLPGATLSDHWLATRVLPHKLQPLGDVNGDGFADAVTCTLEACEIYTGSSDGPSDRAPLRLPPYERVLGTVLDPDRYSDVIGFRRNEVAFHSGSAEGPRQTPTRTTVLPLDASLNAYLAEATGDEFFDLLGLGTTGPDTKLWLLPGVDGMSKDEPARLFRWPKVGDDERSLRAVLQRGKQRPPLLLALKRNATGFDQLSFSTSSGVQPHAVEPPVIRYLDLSSFKAKLVGDFNGDGFDDLLLESMMDIDGSLIYRVYLGSAQAFDANHAAAELISATSGVASVVSIE